MIFYKDNSPKKAVTNEQPVQNIPAPVVQTQAATDDSELIAVLTAAIAASLNTSTYNLKIKSYRRIDNAWNKSGIRENTLNKTY